MDRKIVWVAAGLVVALVLVLMGARPTLKALPAASPCATRRTRE